MGDAGLLRLLALTRRELSAQDARLEIGGAPHEDPRILWCNIGPHRRLCAIFDVVPEGRAEKLARLEALAGAFHDIADAAMPETVGATQLARAALDAELEGVCTRASAQAAVIIDRTSPIVWGRSHAALPERVDTLLERVDDDDALLRIVARAVASVRELTDGSTAGHLRKVHAGDGFALLTRSIAGSYLLVVAFAAPFSEIRADGVARRVLTRLERLLAALPPIEPPPRGRRALSLARP